MGTNPEHNAMGALGPVGDSSSDGSPAIVQSYTAEQEKFERESGLKINPAILNVAPQGARLIVALNPIIAEYKGIVVPETYRQADKSGSGWVISVGPDVGKPSRHPYGPLCASPDELVYRQVIFGAYAGKVIRVEFLDRKTESPYLMLTDLDIWCIDWNPKVERE